MTNPKDEQPGRRRFLTAVTATLGAVVTGVLAVPGAAYVLDPILRRTRTEGAFRRILDAASLRDDTPVAATVIGDRVDAWTRAKNERLGSVWLQKRGDRVVAHSAECPHLGCRIGFDAAHDRFFCPCHASAFDKDGQVLSGPSPRPMDELEARVQDGVVEVRFLRFRTNKGDREEIG